MRCVVDIDVRAGLTGVVPAVAANFADCSSDVACANRSADVDGVVDVVAVGVGALAVGVGVGVNVTDSDADEFGTVTADMNGISGVVDRATMGGSGVDSGVGRLAAGARVSTGRCVR